MAGLAGHAKLGVKKYLLGRANAHRRTLGPTSNHALLFIPHPRAVRLAPHGHSGSRVGRNTLNAQVIAVSWPLGPKAPVPLSFFDQLLGPRLRRFDILELDLRKAKYGCCTCCGSGNYCCTIIVKGKRCRMLFSCCCSCKCIITIELFGLARGMPGASTRSREILSRGGPRNQQQV